MPKAESQSPPPSESRATSRHKYWQENIRYVLILLAVWFTGSYGFGILLADWLNQFKLPGSGFKLGFWCAQQGSIYVFVILIAVYIKLMNKLDSKYGVSED